MLAIATDLAALEEAACVCAPSSTATGARALQPSSRAMRKCVSTPTLHALCCPPDGQELEVYVVMRSFTEFGGGLFRKLPRPVRQGVRDSGICHYMTVFKQPDGSLVQFDFGPKGGDIHVAHGPFARILSKAPVGGRKEAAVGEVREYKVAELPAAHMYVGRTNLSIEDIRAWNSMHRREYELHVNDCRHYVNSLVKYTTGLESAASSCLRHQWVNNRSKYGLANRLVRLGQIITDLSNWERVKAVSQASFTAVAALATHGTFTKLTAAPLIQSVRRSLVPVTRRALVPVVSRQGMVKAVVPKPVYAVGTAAVATCAVTGAPPLVRETATVSARIAGGVKTAVRAASMAAASVAQNVGKRASIASRRTTDQAAAVVAGMAATATRGAAAVMQGKPKAAATTMTRPVRPTAAAGMVPAGRGANHPLRITLPSFNAERAQRLVLVATRK